MNEDLGVSIVVRKAQSEDADAITEIHRAARESYYGRFLDPEDAARDRTPMCDG